MEALAHLRKNRLGGLTLGNINHTGARVDGGDILTTGLDLAALAPAPLYVEIGSSLDLFGDVVGQRGGVLLSVVAVRKGVAGQICGRLASCDTLVLQLSRFSHLKQGNVIACV